MAWILDRPRDAPVRRPSRLFVQFVALLATTLLCACQSAMSSDRDFGPYPGAPNIDRRYTGTVADWPLFFIKHHFASDCFDTQYCRVAYGSLSSEDEKPTRSIESFGSDYPSILTSGVRIGIDNFAGPVDVTWRSKDGTALDARIDFEALFKDRLVPIPPGVKREDIPDRIGIGPTTIIVEVSDRTINVYTRTRIPMKEAQTPGNRYSFNNGDLVRVFTQTY